MRNIIRLFFLILGVSAIGVGCGGTDDLNQISGASANGTPDLSRQGFRVVLSLQDLAEIAPPTVPQTTSSRSRTIVYVADADRRVIAQKEFAVGESVDWVFTDLPIGTYEVGVVFRVGGQFWQTGYVTNQSVSANRILVLERSLFSLVLDFTPPDGLAVEESVGLINVGPGINAVHIVGESPCPQLVGNLAIGNNTDQPVDIEVMIASPLFIDSPTTFTLPANTGAALLDVFFNCSTTESFVQDITIRATSPDGTVETKTVTVSVEIQR